MRQDAGSRRPSLLESLFAQRQVYMRSGHDCRYVALSRPLQIAVALGLVVIAVWLALASYGAIANHLEVRAQRQTLARLQTAAPAALAKAQAARERAERLAEASAAEAGELRQALNITDARVQQASGQVQRLEAEREALLEQFAAGEGQEPASEAVVGLRAQLEAATRLIEELTNERVALRSRIEQLLAAGAFGSDGPIELAKAGQPEAGAGGKAKLVNQLAALKGASGEPALAGVEQAIAALESDLVAAKDIIADVQEDLGNSDRLADLDLKLVDAEEQIDALDTNLERIKAHQSALRAALAAQSQQPPPPKPH